MKIQLLSRPKISLPTILIISAILFQLLWFLRLWLNLLDHPSLNEMDFLSFYTAGSLAKSAGLQNIYNLDLQHALQIQIAGPNFSQVDPLPYNHSPFTLPILMLIMGSSYRTSYIFWTFFLLFAVALSLFFLVRALKNRGVQPKSALTFGIVGFLFYPVFISVLKGQDSAILLLGASLWMYAFFNKKDTFAGLALSLTTIKPQFALILAIPFIFNRRRVWWGFCMGAAILVGFSFLLIGPTGFQGYLNLISIFSQGEGFGINPTEMYNFMGLIQLAFPTIDPTLSQVLRWGIFLIAIVGLSFLWKNAKENLSHKHISILVILSLFTSPHLYFHDLTLLLIPITSLIIFSSKGSIRTDTAVSIVAGASLLLMIAEFPPYPWLHTTSYVLILVLLLFLWFYPSRTQSVA